MKGFYNYYKTIRSFPKLKASEEIDLAKRIENGNKEAQEILFKHNLKLVASIANKYRGRGVPIDDIIAEGNLGLYKATEKYDYRRGRFSTFATACIKDYIQKSIRKQTRIINLPQHVIEKIDRIKKSNKIILDDISKEIGWNIDKIKSILNVANCTVTLDDNFVDICEGNNKDPLYEVCKKELRINIENLIEDILKPEEKLVLKMKYGLLDGIYYSNKEISQKIKLTTSRITQLESDSIKKLRSPGNIKVLIRYMAD